MSNTIQPYKSLLISYPSLLIPAPLLLGTILKSRLELCVHAKTSTESFQGEGERWLNFWWRGLAERVEKVSG